ncbi:MAG: MarR family transcriptional regulator, partial [Oscillospiraceae bacterium]|nr:MarR family transcriptional regulator [Oscillospiraceae bacterium]
MPEYKIELKQIVEYPRCRIYRQFIRTLMEDRSIRASGGSGLFYFTILCSYANFRTSYKRIGGINYTIYPSEWLCRIDEITKWFRTRFHWQAISILDKLQEQKLITYTRLCRGSIIKFKIKGWRHFNTILDYNAPCQKDTGFFFLPVSKAAEIINTERCSEMDIVLDLWINTVYNDEQVEGSEASPVVYMRNGTGSPLVGYSDLALRWGLSKATVGRILK